MVEGGSGLITEFLKEKLADEIITFIAPKIIGKGKQVIGDLEIEKLGDAIQFDEIRYKQIDDQIVFNGVIKCSQD